MKELNVELKFSNMDDFNPVAVLKQVAPLKKLYDARQRLSDLLTKLDGNDELDQLLQDVVASTESLEEIKTLYGGEEGAAAGEAETSEADETADTEE